MELVTLTDLYYLIAAVAMIVCFANGYSSGVAQ